MHNVTPLINIFILPPTILFLCVSILVCSSSSVRDDGEYGQIYVSYTYFVSYWILYLWHYFSLNQKLFSQSLKTSLNQTFLSRCSLQDCLKIFHPRRDKFQNIVRDRDQTESLGNFSLKTKRRPRLSSFTDFDVWIF